MDFGKEIHPAFVNLYPVHIQSTENYTVFPPDLELSQFNDWYRDTQLLNRFYKHSSPDLSPDYDEPF